ncbi:Sodium/hydrogen exchanger-like protein 1 [Elsinoe fawcettii]|nr:Sodium/hydrogen exchanger-like protein 1 [Elsinoe fawcettii]
MSSAPATVTATLLQTVTRNATSSAATATSTNRAPSQGGVIEGLNPTHFNPKDPIVLFIIQATLIITLCRMLEWPLRKLRQPRVISEVIGGIVLGPSIMGRIPGFTAAIFPAAAMPNLTLVANLGLTLFLFIVGLEVDLRFLASNWRVALSVSALGMILPFGMGVAIAYGLYNEFNDEPNIVPISFGVFALFIGIAMAITAFPVLCRILTELDLLQTPVGVITLAAGVGNDVVGWILLALCVALVNAGTGLAALYILLATVGFVLFVVYAIRPGFIWILRKTRSFEDGPSQGVIALTILIALACAFFTAIIGVHAIFGAFVAGLIMPHEGGFAIKVTEKIEDLVGAVLLPLFFTLSGLNTNLGLLDNGITWAYVIGVIAVAFVAKFVGGTVAARANGLLWRESSTIGALMSCKGLVELIVLNIGLQARILSVRTFTIFVVMALVTTFATTPLTAYLYPLWYQKKVAAWKRGEIDWDGNASASSEGSVDSVAVAKEDAKVKTLLVYLRLDNMPSLLAFVSLFGGHAPSANKIHPSKEETEKTASPTEPHTRPVEVHGLRLMELTDRGSSVMKVSEIDEYTTHDPVINTFRTVGRLNNLAVSGEVAIGPETSYADMLIAKATNEDSDLLLLPWSETGGMHEMQLISNDSEQQKLESSVYSTFAARALDTAVCTTAVFVDRGFGGGPLKTRPSMKRTVSSLSLRSNRDNITTPASDKGHHIFVPFFGGADGRAALRLALQMAENPFVTATIVFFENTSSVSEVLEEPMSANPQSPTKHTRVAVQPATREKDAGFFAAISKSVPAELVGRVVFETVPGEKPVDNAVERARVEVGQNPRNGGDLVVLARNKGWFGGDVNKVGTLGAVANRIVEAGVKSSLCVVQARRE